MTRRKHPDSDLRIAYRRLDELRENPANARLHPEKQLAQFARSIESFGFNVPVLIDASGMLLAGHGRLTAARRVGLESIPTIRVDHLSEAQRRAFVLAENGRWDEEKLAIELEAILELETSFEITDTGFEIGEVDHLIEELHKPEREDEEEPVFDPDRVDQVCRRGDLWLMGRHRLFCGDALDPLSYSVLMGDERAAMAFTDAPYNLKIPGVVSGLGKVMHSDFVEASGEMSREEFVAFLTQAMRCMREASSDGSLHFHFMDWRQVRQLIEAGEAVYDELKGLVVWDKGSGGMGSLYRGQHELIGVFKAGKGSHVNNVKLGAHGRNRSNVWRYAGMSSFGKGRAEKLAWHPTVKPVALVGDAILDCSNPGDLVLDPFAGSGTTAIAAERTRRRAALIELDPQFCDVILRRFCDATGIEPANAWTGEIVARKPLSEGEDSHAG